MEPPKDMNYVSAEYNSFLKPPGQMKGSLVMIYTKEHLSYSEYIVKYVMFQRRLFVIHKLISSCMIGLYVYKEFSLKRVTLIRPYQ